MTIKCTAARCLCARCGTSGRGDVQAAIGRIKERVQAELRRIAIREGGKPIPAEKNFGVVIGENDQSPPLGYPA